MLWHNDSHQPDRPQPAQSEYWRRNGVRRTLTLVASATMVTISRHHHSNRATDGAIDSRVAVLLYRRTHGLCHCWRCAYNHHYYCHHHHHHWHGWRCGRHYRCCCGRRRRRHHHKAPHRSGMMTTTSKRLVLLLFRYQMRFDAEASARLHLTN